MRLVGKTQQDLDKDLEKERYQKKLENLEAYLKETDWYVTRSLEDPDKRIPEDIKKLRKDARESISSIRERLSK